MQQVMHHKAIAVLFLICLALPLCYAAPPFSASSSTNDGIIIVTPIIEYKIANQSFNQNVHVINKSNGAVLTNAHVVCVYHLYNSSGEHLTLLNMTYNPTEVEWETMINANNFSWVGQYSRIIVCNYTDGTFRLGDATDFSFIVNQTGLVVLSGWVVIIFMLIFITISVGYMFTTVSIIEDFASANINAYVFIKYLGMYLGMIAFYYFNQEFANITIIESVLSMLIKVGVFTHGLIPAFGFGYSLIIGKIKDANNMRNGG